MTTDHRPPRRVSLRRLAIELDTHHSTLSTAVRDRRLRAGVRLDKRGRVVVDDADAAARNWRAVHVPQVLELERIERREAKAHGDDAIVLMDVAMDCHVTARQLFAERDALSVLVTALVAELLGDDRRARAKRIATLEKSVASRLRAVAELHGAEVDALDRARRDLTCAIAMIVDDDETGE